MANVKVRMQGSPQSSRYKVAVPGQPEKWVSGGDEIDLDEELSRDWHRQNYCVILDQDGNPVASEDEIKPFASGAEPGTDQYQTNKEGATQDE